jgi:N-acetylglutamate synthase-like GNAT family acetyltransferase
MTEDIQIREADETDLAWITDLLQAQWGSTTVVSRGKSHDASRLPALVALLHGERVGLLTYHIDNSACEIVSLDSLVEEKGIGSALIDRLKEIARKASCQRVWLITTNDNLHALRFYQKRGFTLSALYPNALAQTRKMKPHLSLLGREGIPLRDEIEMEILLKPQGEGEVH